MNKALGISGYFILILSAAFLDIPFLGLLAIPTFLIGVILLLIFYLKLIDIKKSFMWFFIILVVIGVLMLSGALGYSAVEFNQYLVSKHRGEEILYLPWVRIIQIIGINIVSSFVILAGIKHSSKLNKEKLLVSWIPSFFIIPVTIVLIKILEIIGTPLST